MFGRGWQGPQGSPVQGERDTTLTVNGLTCCAYGEWWGGVALWGVGGRGGVELRRDRERQRQRERQRGTDRQTERQREVMLYVQSTTNQGQTRCVAATSKIIHCM